MKNKDPRNTTGTFNYKLPETKEEYIDQISKFINNELYGAEQITLIFSFHNLYVLPESPEWSKSCSACKKRVVKRTKEYFGKIYIYAKREGTVSVFRFKTSYLPTI